MGNTPPTPTSLRHSNNDHSYELQIPGTSASINYRGKQSSLFEAEAKWKVSYMVDNKPTCTITLIMPKQLLFTSSVLIIIKEDDIDGANFWVSVAKSGHEEGLLITRDLRVVNGLFEDPFISSTINALGELITTKFYFHGHGKRLSLLVSQWKRKSSDKHPCTGTIVHYYINTENGQDIGLSVALKRIRVISGVVDYAVDGPEQHPVPALLYMFDQVKRTKSWKPSCCPHCANNIIKMQRAGIWQSENEDNDIDNYVHTALVRGRERQQDAKSGEVGGLVTNDGTFTGHHNGNIKIKNLFLGGK